MELTSRKLAEYAHELSFDDFSNEVINQTQKLVLDTLGCGINAYTSPPSKRLRSVYGNRLAADDGATLMGTQKELTTEYAGLLNAVMVRYIDFNDCYSTASSACHPSDMIPSLISVAEAEGATGEELVEAIVLAYEIQCRGVDTGVAWNNGFDYVTWGTHASTVSVGKLMDLSEEELVNAIGIAGASSNSLLNGRLGKVSNWKGMAQPYATHNAIQACQMARADVTGPEHVFEGDGGFFDAIARGESVKFEALGGRDGEFRIMETSLKEFACGYFTHGSVTAVLDVVKEEDLYPEEIEAIDIETFEHAIQVYASGPEKWATDLNRETADHSLPYNVSVAVIDREVTPTQYNEEHLTDDQIHELMQKVSAEESEELTAHRQENPRHIPAKATIKTTDGNIYTNRVNYPSGHPERPLSMDAIEQKFTNLVDDYLSDNQINATIQACQEIEQVDDFDSLVENLVI
jgi:2-methylcitrate dehydratase